MLHCRLRREYDPAALLKQNPPVFTHPHKRLVFELACPPGAVHRGPVTLTRWSAAALPSSVTLASTEVLSAPGYYDYAGPEAGVWHVNFADPRLFVAYGSALLAQDELQAVEHPLLGSLREALLAEQQPALTVDAEGPTPVLVTGVERRCALSTQQGLYGNRFARASADEVRKAIRIIQPPTRSNLIAIAASVGKPGPYFPKQIETILVTAFTGFAAAVQESRQLWPGAKCEVRTGFWGCGAFGGNRELMTLLQLLAARLAGVSRVRFYVFDAAGEADFRAGAAALEEVLSEGAANEPLADLLARIDDRDYEWGVGDGN